MVTDLCRSPKLRPPYSGPGHPRVFDTDQSDCFRTKVAKTTKYVAESFEVESHSRLNAEHRRALRLLADAPHGCAISIMLAHGFSNAMLDKLVRDGVATLQPGTVRCGTRRITVVWMTITDIGRGALAVE
jgi:hypothetical protein